MSWVVLLGGLVVSLTALVFAVVWFARRKGRPDEDE
jgi:hypothetical protein